MRKKSSVGPKLMIVGCGMVLTGCYSPGGGLMPATSGPKAYVSNEMMQKTVTVYDMRTNEAFFGIDIPPGRMLVMDFDEGEGDDPVYRPALLRWELMDAGENSGKLSNAMSVPGHASRRVEVTLRRGVQYAPVAQAERPLRTDELIDRPAWWTPEGGPLPQDKALGLYD